MKTTYEPYEILWSNNGHWNRLNGNLLANNPLNSVEIPRIEKVIFQKTHTIVLWKDKSEPTIVNCYKEEFDKEKGLAMAIAKKYMQRSEFKKLIENASYQDK